MSLLHRLFCKLGFHQRSRKSARRTETGWRSQCRWCGQPMIKVKGGDWRVVLRAAKPSREEQAELRRSQARQRRMPPPPRRSSKPRP